MKGRVLVALADGTLAIFHRAEGLPHLTHIKLISLLILMLILMCEHFIYVMQKGSH